MIGYGLILKTFCLLCLCSCSPQDRTTQFRKYQIAGDKAYVDSNYEEAERQYRSALQVAEKGGPENDLVVSGLRSLAQVYMAQGKYDQVEAFYRKRQAIADKIWSQDPGNLATVYDDLAILYLRTNKFTEAKPLYERALSLNETAFGPDSEKVADSLELYALLLRKAGHNDEAARMDERAATIRAKKLSETGGQRLR